MTHTNDAQTVHTHQTWSVCKPQPWLIFEARLVFKARPLLVQLRPTPSLYSRPGLYLRKYGNSIDTKWGNHPVDLVLSWCIDSWWKGATPVCNPGMVYKILILSALGYHNLILTVLQSGQDYYQKSVRHWHSLTWKLQFHLQRGTIITSNLFGNGTWKS